MKINVTTDYNIHIDDIYSIEENNHTIEFDEEKIKEYLITTDEDESDNEIERLYTSEEVSNFDEYDFLNFSELFIDVIKSDSYTKEVELFYKNKDMKNHHIIINSIKFILNGEEYILSIDRLRDYSHSDFAQTIDSNGKLESWC